MAETTFEFGHAKAVGLDALISHDVVLQHQSAVVEPDFPALSLLYPRVAGPSCQSEENKSMIHNY